LADSAARPCLKGKIDRIDKQLEALPRERVEVMQALASLDAVFLLHEVRVEPKVIVGVRTHKPALTAHGVMTKAILTCLREAGGTPQFTREIAFYVARVADLDIAAKDDQLHLFGRIRRRLQKLRADGLVESVHIHGRGITDEGRWVLASVLPDRKAAAQTTGRGRPSNSQLAEVRCRETCTAGMGPLQSSTIAVGNGRSPTSSGPSLDVGIRCAAGVDGPTDEVRSVP